MIDLLAEARFTLNLDTRDTLDVSASKILRLLTFVIRGGVEYLASVR